MMMPKGDPYTKLLSTLSGVRLRIACEYSGYDSCHPG